MLVEDDEDDYLIAHDMLSDVYGVDLRIDRVSTWDKGLAAICDASHDVYLVDVRLGTGSGLELVRAAAAKGSTKPIILLTGKDRPDIDLEAMRAGATDYLIKGQITADVLARSIRYGINQKRVEDELRESEGRFRTVVDNSPTKVQIKDTDGRFVLINREAEKLLGVTDEEARGKTVHEIFPDKPADELEAHDQDVLETGGTIAEEEQWAMDDGVHTYLTVNFPIRGGQGEIVAIGAIGTDITVRKQAEAAVSAAMEEAKIANRAKSEFLAAMSHELRTPLNAIIGFTEFFTSEKFGPIGNLKYREYANDICESGQHLLGLINDILDLSKIEAGKDELHEAKIEISEIIRSALQLVGRRVQHGEIKLELELPDQLPALYADERKLKQILVNLLSNAIKFTEPGGKVTLKTWCRMDGGYVIEVVDTGIGIAPEDIPKALSRFGQVEGNLNRQYVGTGLGLPLTKALVEQHSGVLDLQSEVGVGTTVTVRFPAERIITPLENSDTLVVEERAAS